MEALLEHEAAPRLLGMLGQKFDAVRSYPAPVLVRPAWRAVTQQWHHWGSLHRCGRLPGC